MNKNFNNGVYKIYCENGYYLFKLELILSKMNSTKYALAKNLPTEYKVLNNYARGVLTRFDINVIARICDYLNCNLSDIIEYFPNTKA